MQFVFLNVSGTAFQALKDTLLRIPLFEAYFANMGLTETTESLFVDRNYDMFEEIYSLVASDGVPSSKAVTEEMMYYGLSDNAGLAEDKAKRELAIMMECSTAFHVNACGKCFQTSKKRLVATPYFEAMFNGEWKEGLDRTLGSKSNPVFVNIPPKQFETLLQDLRCGINTLNTSITPTPSKDVTFWKPQPLQKQISSSIMFNVVNA